MAKILTTQTFHRINEFANHYGIVLPKPREDWRLIKEPMIGHINGLPNTQGRAVATNGVLVAVERSGDIFLGHLDFFVADEQYENAIPKAFGKPKKRHDPEPDMSDYMP